MGNKDQDSPRSTCFNSDINFGARDLPQTSERLRPLLPSKCRGPITNTLEVKSIENMGAKILHNAACISIILKHYKFTVYAMSLMNSNKMTGSGDFPTHSTSCKSPGTATAVGAAATAKVQRTVAAIASGEKLPLRLESCSCQVGQGTSKTN